MNQYPQQPYQPVQPGMYPVQYPQYPQGPGQPILQYPVGYPNGYIRNSTKLCRIC